MTYAARLKEISEAVFDYLSREDAIRNGIIPVTEALPVPDILLIYNQTLAFPGTLPWPGGLLQQPWALMQELSACKDGLERYFQVANAPRPEATGTGHIFNASPESEADRMSSLLNLPGL